MNCSAICNDCRCLLIQNIHTLRPSTAAPLVRSKLRGTVGSRSKAFSQASSWQSSLSKQSSQETRSSLNKKINDFLTLNGLIDKTRPGRYSAPHLFQHDEPKASQASDREKPTIGEAEAATEAIPPKWEEPPQMAQMREVLEGTDPSGASIAWSLCVQLLDQDSSELHRQLAKHENARTDDTSVFRALLKRCTVDWRRDPGPANVSPQLVIQRLVESKMMRLRWYFLPLKGLLLDSLDARKDLKDRQAALDQALWIWDIFFTQYAHRRMDSSEPNIVSSGDTVYLSRFRALTPIIKSESDAGKFAVLAMLTFHVLTFRPCLKLQSRSVEPQARARTFRNIIAPVVYGSDLSGLREVIQKELKPETMHIARLTTAIKPFMHHLLFLPSEALLSPTSHSGALPSGVLPSPDNRSQVEPSESDPSRASHLSSQSMQSGVNSGEHSIGSQKRVKATDPFVQRIEKRLGRALEQQQPETALELWKSMVNRHKESKTAAAQHQLKIYDAFISAFMSFEQPDKAVMVWNHMRAIGLQPTIVTWTAMLKGAIQSKRQEAMRAIWQQMQTAGVHLDAMAWGVYIEGLISFGAVQEGLDMLYNIGNTWLDGRRSGKSKRSGSDSPSSGNASGDVTQVAAVAPSITLVNVAIAALHKGRNESAVREVLDWARMLNLQPDPVTYNLRLTSALKRKSRTDMLDILREMQESSVTPDETTATLVFRGLLDTGMHDDGEGVKNGPVQEKPDIIDCLQRMKTVGIPLNIFIYGIAVRHALREGDDMEAITNIFAHMQEENVEASHEIYTMLISHYFKQQPPNIAAVDTLWHHIRLARGVRDAFFYDRMIEGYAEVSETGKMMAVMTRMSKDGNHPSWPALTAAIVALSRTGEVEQIKEIISDVHKEVMRPDDGYFKPGQKFGRARFWNVASSLGNQVYDDLVKEGLIEPQTSSTKQGFVRRLPV